MYQPLTAWCGAGDVPEAKRARKYSVLTSPVPAAADGSPVSDSSKEGTLDPEAGVMVVDLLKPDKRKTPVPSKPRRLFGLTTLAALRQRPQLAALSRQKEAQLSTAKAEQLRSSSPPARPSASDDTAGPSNAPLHASPRHAGMAAESALAGPGSATAAASSDWNLAQSSGANRAQHEVHGMPVHSDSAEPASEPPAPVTDGATTSPANSLPKTQPKLANRNTLVHHGDQVAVTDNTAGPSHPEPAGSMPPAAESAAAAMHDGATAIEQLSTAQETQRAQPMQAQQAGTSQQAAASGHAWGTLSPHRHAPPGQVADESFPPLSQARERRPRPVYHPPAGLSADTAGPSGHTGTAELSFGDFTAGTSSLAASVRQPGGSLPQQGNDLGANAEPSRHQAQTAELQSGQQAEADDTQARAESSLQASVTEAASAAPAEAVGPSLVFGQGITGRGAFQLSNELQMALSGKPKPGRRGQVAVPLPEPSADLVLQRALMEKPKPRPRPRRPPVTPQSTGIFSQSALTAILPSDTSSRIDSVTMEPIAFILHLWLFQCNALAS